MTTESSYTLPRSGNSPLRFRGRLLARAGEPLDQEQTQHYEGEIYALGGGRYVAAVHYITRWAHERPWHHALLCADADAVRKFFRAADPLAPFVGPPGDHPKRDYIAKRLLLQYDEMVSALLQSDELAEEVA